jgi:hypothetical protein
LEDADGDEESEGGNTNTIGLRNGSKTVKNSIPTIHSEHRTRVTQHHQHSSSHYSGGRGTSSSSHGRKSKEHGSIVGIRNRKSSSVDEMICGDATIHRGEIEDDLISTTSSSVKRRQSHGGAYTTTSSDTKERVSNDGDNENDVEDEEDEEDEDNRGTMRRRRIRTTSASDHSEVSGTRPSSYNTPNLKSTVRDRLHSGEIGDADDDDDDDQNGKAVAVTKKVSPSTPHDMSYNATILSQRSSQSQTPDDDNGAGKGDIGLLQKKLTEEFKQKNGKKEKILEKPKDFEFSQEKQKLFINNDESFSRSLSECEEYKGQHNAATLKRNVLEGSVSNSRNGQDNTIKVDAVETSHVKDSEGKKSHLHEVPFTTSPPSFPVSSNQDESFLNNPFSFGRPSLPAQNQQQSHVNRPSISRTSMGNSKSNIQHFKHYDHREQLHEEQSEHVRNDPQYPNVSSHQKHQQPFDLKALTSTTPASRRDFSQHAIRRGEERQLTVDHRRRSASIGDRLSDVDNIDDDDYRSHRTTEGSTRRDRENNSQDRSTYREDVKGYRKSHTLDDRHSRRGNDGNRGRTIPNQSFHQSSHNHEMGSFQSIVPPNSGGPYASSTSGFVNTKKIHHQQPSANSSTKSEKSSSRSSQSPSVDSNKYGKRQ